MYCYMHVSVCLFLFLGMCVVLYFSSNPIFLSHTVLSNSQFFPLIKYNLVSHNILWNKLTSIGYFVSSFLVCKEWTDRHVRQSNYSWKFKPQIEWMQHRVGNLWFFYWSSLTFTNLLSVHVFCINFGLAFTLGTRL